MKTEIHAKVPFDAPVWELLLQQLERAAPGDLVAWRDAEAAEFAAAIGISRGLPGRARKDRLIKRLGDILRSDDKYAGSIAFSGLRGHVLRPLLAGRPGLLPAAARGRVLLTDRELPRTGRWLRCFQGIGTPPPTVMPCGAKPGSRSRNIGW